MSCAKGEEEVAHMNRHNPVVEVPLKRRMSEWDWRVTIQQGDDRMELYKGQSAVNAMNFYRTAVRTVQFLKGSAVVQAASLDGKREVGGFKTGVVNGRAEEDHVPYGVHART